MERFKQFVWIREELCFCYFESIEEANRAIDCVKVATIDGVEVHVSLAKKQLRMPNNSSGSTSSVSIQPTSSSSAPQSWGSMTANYYKEYRAAAKRESSQFKKQAVVYDEASDLWSTSL